MSGVLEQAIQYLQTQQQAMQSMMGSGGGSSGGIGDLFPQTPMTGGGQTQSVSQPSTMEVPAPPVAAPPVATTPPVTNTTPVSTPPAPASTPTPTVGVTPTPTTPMLSTNPVGLGDLINGSALRPRQTPQERFADTDIDSGFFDSDEYTQSQQGPRTSDMGYTSDYGFGSGLSSSGGRAQDQAYEDYLNRTGQGDRITREQPAFQQNFLDQIKQAQAGGQGIFGNLSQRPDNPMLDQRIQALGVSGLGQMGLGGDPRFAGLGQMGLGGDPRFAGLGQMAGRPVGLGQDQMRLMQQAQMQMMKQRQALPAQQFVPQARPTPQPSSMAGMNLGVGLNPMFGRAFAGKSV